MSDHNPTGIAVSPRRFSVEGYRQQRGLYRLTDRLYRAQSMAEAYDATLEAVGELFGCEKISILRFDKNCLLYTSDAADE